MKFFKEFINKLPEIAGVEPEKLQCTVEGGELELSGKDFGNCKEIGKIKYIGNFKIENFAGDADILFALVIAWIENNDEHRNYLSLSDPKFYISNITESYIEINLSINFEESLFVVEDADGSIFWMNKYWSMNDLNVDIAEELIGLECKSDFYSHS
ncbi:phage tail protein [Maridesulfovibrio bastinii]|uniref:phage tail protein n=1 Tax=Maridesulfovibrio bastinii TaxID=47157 RepID=UPI00040D190C|nr:phage tail protein [Maridesulfovibrio bastinii]